jgi:hypothetical protein
MKLVCCFCLFNTEGGGANGWEPDIPHQVTKEPPMDKKENITIIREFMAFRIQERKCEFGNILFFKRLFQQFVVDCYTMVELVERNGRSSSDHKTMHIPIVEDVNNFEYKLNYDRVELGLFMQV